MDLVVHHGSTPLSVHVDPAGTVRAMKRVISKQLSCKVSQIRLIYDGHVLKNDRLLSTVPFEPSKKISLIVEEDDQPPASAAKPKTPDELDEEFVAAIYSDPLRERLNDPYSFQCVLRIKEHLSDLTRIGFGDYNDLIQRLDLVPEPETDPEPAPPPPT